MKGLVLAVVFTGIVLLGFITAPAMGNCKSKKVYNHCGELCTCSGSKLTNCYRVRRDFFTMKLGERLRFVRALVKISTSEPYKKMYEKLIAEHTREFGSGIHKKEQFLPWHRLYLLKMENILRKIDCRVSVPYWDWSVFSGQPWRNTFKDVFSPTPWGLGGDGGRGYCVVNGPFRQLTWRTTASNGRQCLKRRFNGNPPDMIAVHEVLRTPASSFDTFERVLRDVLHNNMHCRIGGRGGTMCSRGSANAPEFLLHHGFTDKIWADWQKKGKRSIRDAYFKNIGGKKMKIVNYAPRDLLDLSNQPGGVKVMYEDPGHDHYHTVHRYLDQLSLAEIKALPRHRFSIVGTLEFKTFMVKDKKEQAKVNAQQKALEPKKSISEKSLRTTTDKAMGFKMVDVEKAVKRKRSLELRKKEALDVRSL